MGSSQNPYKNLKFAPQGICYEFGGFRFHGDAQVVFRGAKCLALTPKVVETLRVLLENAGTVVSTETFMAEVWPGRFVEEGGLTRNISDLRKALGRVRRADSYIETIPKRGYRFVAPVRTVQYPKAAAKWNVAVQPLGSGENQRPAKGIDLAIAQTLVDKLTTIPDCEVRLTTTASQVGAELVVQVSVRRSKGIQISIRFVDAAAGSPIWVETFDYVSNDPHGFEESVSEQTAGAVALWFSRRRKKVPGRRYTTSAEAYSCYLRANFHANKRSEKGILEATRWFRRSVELDHDYAHAYAGLAASYALLPMLAPIRATSCMPKARTAAVNALEIDETLIDARSALAFVKWHFDWDWSGSEREFRRILQFHSRDAVTRQWYALLLVEQGRSSEAIEQAAIARRIDPGSATIRANLATVLHFAGRHDDALREARQALSLDPHSIRAYLIIGLALEQQGHLEEAVRQFEKGLQFSARTPFLLGSLGHAYGLMGRTTLATKVARRLQGFRYPSACGYAKALIAAGIGRTDEALLRLEQACAEKDFQLVLLKVDRRFDGLRNVRRFQAIANQIKPD